MNDGRLPAKLHITNGKKIYAVSGIRKIGDDMYRLGERDIAISRYQIQRNDSSMEYAFAPKLGNIPVLISYMDNGKTYVLTLKSAKINGQAM